MVVHPMAEIRRQSKAVAASGAELAMEKAKAQKDKERQTARNDLFNFALGLELII